MSLNFQQLYERIRAIGQGTILHQEQVAKLREQALALLQEYAGQHALLLAKIARARSFDPTLRCAIPLTERLDARHPAPAVSEPAILIAADGSHIAPDRHAQVLYSLLNIGAICLETASGKAPELYIESTLLYEEELYTENGLLSEETLEQQRDLAERRKLLELAQGIQSKAERTVPILALTEGPLELWGARESNSREYLHNLEAHQAILSRMQEKGIIVAGYVDKPGADLLVRLLEIATLGDDVMSEIRHHHPLRGVTDRWLLGQLLPAGYRSSIFGLQSVSSARYSGALALHFFYLNVGDARHPHLARVEIPGWIAEDEAQIDRLHAALLEQCRLMGSRPYPYLLHRAHETAVIHFDEKQQIERMLAVELRRAGVEVEEESYKQSAKNLPRH